MKKFLVTITSILVIFCTGCATTSAVKTTMTTELIGNPIPDYAVSVVGRTEFGDSWYHAAHSGEGFSQTFDIEIINNSNTIGKIVWDNSSITDSDGTHRIFLQGMRFIKAGDPISDMIVPPGSKNIKTISSADSVEWSSLGNCWVLKQMSGFDFTITICINTDGKDNYVINKVHVQ